MFGSVMWLLCFAVMPGTPLQNLLVCWRFISRFYKEQKTEHRFKFLNKLSMFVRKSGFPKLRGKAAEIKGFGPSLLALWESKMRPLDVHNQIRSMLQANVRAESILDAHAKAYCLPPAAAVKFEDAVSLMFQLQNQLAEHFLQDEDNVKVFNRTSKINFCCHSARLAKYLNPRMVWCFRGEDMMRHTQKLAKTCVRGLKKTGVPIKMAKCYKNGFHLSLKYKWGSKYK